MTSAEPTMLGQVERILQSDRFRNSEGLRRLLRYLAEKAAAGEDQQLKEYTIGVDGLGKPETYDPRHDAAVRIQLGRLRQKLVEYYHDEGKNDPLVIELPKGQFRLLCAPAQEEKPIAKLGWRMAAAWLCIALFISITWGLYAAIALSRRPQAVARADWTPELQQLWRAFTDSDRPVVVMIADPLFVQFKGFGAYRSQILNTWSEIAASPSVRAIRKALNEPEIERNSRFTGVSEANAAFLLGRFLSPHLMHLSLERSSEISWRQLASNNVIYVGAERIIAEQLKNLPVALEFTYDYAGVVNLHPQPGEPAVFEDPPEILALDASEDGAAYALVSHIPGPSGQGEMYTFASNSPPARLAAVQWFVTPVGARDLVTRMKGQDGGIPIYYQVLLKIRFGAGVPIETAYVRHRQLRPVESTGEK